MSSDTGETQVYPISINATQEAVWAAITLPDWTERYGYATRVE